MSDFTRSFKKILPSLRQSTMDVLEKQVLSSEQINVKLEDGSEIESFLHKAKSGLQGVVFELHGGGFALSDARKDDELRKRLCKEVDINVIGINYRKTPEYRYPVAINDAYEVIKYYYKNAYKYGFDKDKFMVLGFSAGANLATVVAMKFALNKELNIYKQVLVYPYLDASKKPENKKYHKADLPVEVMEAFNELYADKEENKNPFVSPIFATDEVLKMLPKTLILAAAEDALCDEALDYTKRLKENNVDIETHIIEEMHHGYMEDYFNKACYEILPEDTKALHSKNMKQKAEFSLELITNFIK